MLRSYGIFYEFRNKSRPVLPTFTEEIEKKKTIPLFSEIINTELCKKTFHELWEDMNAAYEKYAIENEGAELTNAINAVTLNDVITMLRHNMSTEYDLKKALKSSSITDVAIKITLIFKPLIRWKVKLHVFTGKNTQNKLIHFHPYKLSSKLLSGRFLNHNYIIRDPLPEDDEEELQNEYLIPGVKREDKDGKLVKYTGKRHISLANSWSCEPDSVQEYQIEDPHSLEYDSSVDGKIVTVAFISPTILKESKVYDRSELSETRRTGFENEEHIYEFLEGVLFHLCLVKLKADLCSSVFQSSERLTRNDEHLRAHIDHPNFYEVIMLPLLAEFILLNEDEINIKFSSITTTFFLEIIKENSVSAVFSAITSSQQNIEEIISRNQMPHPIEGSLYRRDSATASALATGTGHAEVCTLPLTEAVSSTAIMIEDTSEVDQSLTSANIGRLYSF